MHLGTHAHLNMASEAMPTTDPQGWVEKPPVAPWVHEGDLIRLIALLFGLLLFTAWNRLTLPSELGEMKRQHAIQQKKSSAP